MHLLHAQLYVILVPSVSATARSVNLHDVHRRPHLLYFFKAQYAHLYMTDTVQSLDRS